MKPKKGFVSLSRRLSGVGSRTDNRDTATKPIPGFRPSGQLKLFKIVPADFVFACPKKSIQKKRHPEAAASCALTI
ncbi:MAG: hypothetical protein Q8K19_17060, partial [Methylicorpusculum sp.]|uniref:hypothetical protein n=1 Tax=Methylicorpusculum sp. TaxID=2713644 RepID=UPI002730B833